MKLVKTISWGYTLYEFRTGRTMKVFIKDWHYTVFILFLGQGIILMVLSFMDRLRLELICFSCISAFIDSFPMADTVYNA